MSSISCLMPANFEQLLRKYNQPGPRYTSYPTIDQCAEQLGANSLTDALKARAVRRLQRPLSLYVHVPFCSSVCYYCACNKVITKKRDQVVHYIDTLIAEAQWYASNIEGLVPLTQLHLGGGTPTFFTDHELAELLLRLSKVFSFSKQAELSIEVDPRTINDERLENLHALGFNRISFGVQDFDPAVQKAVHRIQSYGSIEKLMQKARELGFQSVNMDLIYGLPKQTRASFSETIQQLISLKPDRVALYSYAHLPERFKPQRRIHSDDLPSPADKVNILGDAIQAMRSAGYDYIGMDHFAKPEDGLSKARRQGLLHRNFQGYTTQPDADLIGLGVSAISKVGTAMAQNTRELSEYLYQVEHNGNAVFRCHVSDRDDLIRQSVIMSLLCQGVINFADFESAHFQTFQDYFGSELEELTEFIQDGLMTIDETGIELTDQGWFFVRPIAMAFDNYVRTSRINRSKVL